MTPIEKNIIVVDKQGNEYEATYPKRAKGLVKNGRARFITQNKICLLCPPEIKMEDNKMSENIDVNVNVNAEDISEMVSNKTDEKMTIGYVLEQIEKIQDETQYLHDCIKGLEKMKQSTADGVDIAGEAKAKALAQIVTCRETTNQRLIAFYEKMYDDLKPTNTTKDRALDVVATAVETAAFEGEGFLEKISDLLDTIRHIG